MNLDFVPGSKIGPEKWNSFCKSSDSAWFRHTTDFVEYAAKSRFDGKSRDISFGVFYQGELFAVVPLVVQTVYSNPEYLEYGMLDMSIPMPAFVNNVPHPDNRKTALRLIFDEIDRLAREHKVAYSRFFSDPLCRENLENRVRVNTLPKLGFTDTSLSENIVNLELGEAAIHSRIRKGHKADIGAGKRRGLKVHVYTKNDCTREIFDCFKRLHILDAGRQTRPDGSWDEMYRWVRDGNAVLALENDESGSGPISGALVMTYSGRAYYGSAATHPDHEGERSLGHFIQWEVMRFLRESGLTFYDIGANLYMNFSQEIASRKEADISHFKSGFGGDIFPLFRGEKFYSQRFFTTCYNERMKTFLAVQNREGEM